MSEIVRLGSHRSFRYLPLCAPIVVGILFEVAFYSGLPFSFRYIIDYGLLGNNRRILSGILIALTAGSLVVASVGVIRDRLYTRLIATILADLRLAIFYHLQRLPTDFFARQKTGDIMARFSADLAVLENAGVNAIG